MKIFHTADWHLGKVVHNVSMLEDQKFVLQQFVQDVKEQKPDAVIIAGDLYDRSIPQVEAVQLLNDVLHEIVVELNTPVLAIAGNHDSATRIEYGSGLMKKAGLYKAGRLTANIEPIVLQDTEGEVHFYLVPFAEPTVVRQVFEDENVTTYDLAMRKIVEHIEMKMDRTKRNVFIGHAFVTKDGEKEENTSDSERRLTVGGTECIDSNMFEAFDYVALGHLHQAHFVRTEKIQYSGSPLKYSESEVTHKKGYLQVKLTTDEFKIEKRLFEPVRDMRVVKGKLEEMLTWPISEDYVFVELQNEGFVKGAVEQVRTVFPNVLHVQRADIKNQLSEQSSRVNRTSMSDEELFGQFYESMIGQQPDEMTQQLFEEALQQLLDDEREKQGVIS